MSGAPLAFTEWLMGAAVLSVAVSVLGLAWWWGAPGRELNAISQIGRLTVALLGHALVLVGLVVLTIGTENLLEQPLGRWSGAPMVFSLWFTLELVTRELVWSTARARRRFGVNVGRFGMAVALGSWLTTKACLGLSVIVALSAFLQS